ncbi:uracil-DNA glycosylase, partial [Alphaproteobacteria bacterium]|nr:uracil-DNA glycosylase [Alphaproteobacteria bacterium]
MTSFFNFYQKSDENFLETANTNNFGITNKQFASFKNTLSNLPNRKILISSDTLDSLKKELKEFDGCALKKTATNLVFSDGNKSAKVMVIGEAPGDEEDKLGKPFKGKAGKLLDKMLGAIGQNRENTYLTNLIFWRPPGNRNPTLEEIDICLPFVLKHIEIINPKILILAGAIASKAILNENNKGIIQLRGKWQNFSLNKSRSIKTMPIYH